MKMHIIRERFIFDQEPAVGKYVNTFVCDREYKIFYITFGRRLGAQFLYVPVGRQGDCLFIPHNLGLCKLGNHHTNMLSCGTLGNHSYDAATRLLTHPRHRVAVVPESCESLVLLPGTSRPFQKSENF
jgi:hypothetical protein